MEWYKKVNPVTGIVFLKARSKTWILKTPLSSLIHQAFTIRTLSMPAMPYLAGPLMLVAVKCQRYFTMTNF